MIIFCECEVDVLVKRRAPSHSAPGNWSVILLRRRQRFGRTTAINPDSYKSRRGTYSARAQTIVVIQANLRNGRGHRLPVDASNKALSMTR
ncbi:hypothetical protein EVAR_17288_1 [Eumeta japonica]|uniref:Uncharacterized protein n=1 Tax=Eumeta variegata TaxID=151549 RepID=A0A4C1TT42_EUMVA|nr:hypothetical protein EVAR_17288_1 [Eumeta japonica]